MIPWEDSVFTNIGRPACMLYAAQFSKVCTSYYLCLLSEGALVGGRVVACHLRRRARLLCAPRSLIH